ncbi:amino acid permease 3-like [Iris pallida]|uniref:Amino acid permease 3-like n=1 Tax=Iris pallida TaxID=29817 RepID=A0AAX6FLX3_IRIPA|nr:amino acid permease 3-like [Iris pallida]
MGVAYQQPMEVSIDMTNQQPPASKRYGDNDDDNDDDGRPKRTGNVQTASSHIITAVIGSGVLSLAWAIGQLGWVAGPTVMLLFAFFIYHTSSLLADCYRSGDPSTGKRNYTYMDAVRSNLGGTKVKLCGYIQYLNLFGVAVGYTIAASISMLAIQRSDCFHDKGHKNPCNMSSNPYMIVFGVTQLVFSQIPDFDQIWWLSVVAAVMSFTYSSIGLALGVVQVVDNGSIKGSLTGISIGDVTQTQKIWRSLQAFGDIAFAYSYSIILIEIQDTIKAPPPSEAKVMKKATLLSVAVTTTFYMLCGCMGYAAPSEAEVMKKATLLSVAVTTTFYMLCGCMGYAAFGDAAPGNLLTGFGFYNPYWLLDVANAAIVVHLVGTYQVYCQPLFAFVEKWARRRWPESKFIVREIRVPLAPTKRSFDLNLFRLVWRSAFVVLTTVISMLLPFFNDVVGLLGALGFWPLTVYFPVEMYIAQKRIPRWSTRWVCLQMLSGACLVVSIAAAVGSIAGVLTDLKVYRPFTSG